MSDSIPFPFVRGPICIRCGQRFDIEEKLIPLAKSVRRYLKDLIVETENGEHQIRYHTIASAFILAEDLGKILDVEKD